MKFEGHTEAVGAVALMKRKHAYETGNAAGFSAGKGITRVRPGMAVGWLLTPVLMFMKRRWRPNHQEVGVPAAAAQARGGG